MRIYIGIILIWLCVLVSTFYCTPANLSKLLRNPDEHRYTVSEGIPKRIVTTTKDKSAIPRHIYDQYKKYATEYTFSIYDNTDCIKFLETFYSRKVVRRFNALQEGAHKADLFRYAYLYIYGGVYLDVKTILLDHISTIFEHHKSHFYMVFTDNDRMYNGILATPRHNKYFLHLLSDIVNGPRIRHYLQYCVSASYILRNCYLINRDKKKGPHQTVDEIPDVVLFKEIFCNADKHCNKRADRYGYCNFAVDINDRKVFKIRDPTYGKIWK